MSQTIPEQAAAEMAAFSLALTRTGLPLPATGMARLVLVPEGSLVAGTQGRSLTVTSGQLLFVPSGMAVALSGRDGQQVDLVCFRPDVFQHALPREPVLLRRYGLVHELIHAAMTIPAQQIPLPRHRRLFQVLLDNLRPEEAVQAFDLPTGRDKRLRRVTERLLEDPALDMSLQQWASIAGASSRTLARLFLAETGMNFKCWRQRSRILRAIELLEEGKSTTSIAYDVGYEAPNAFIASFKATTGHTPSSYLKAADRSALAA